MAFMLYIFYVFFLINKYSEDHDLTKIPVQSYFSFFSNICSAATNSHTHHTVIVIMKNPAVTPNFHSKHLCRGNGSRVILEWSTALLHTFLKRCGAPNSWGHEITRSWEKCKLTQKLLIMQLWIKWYPDLNNSLIWCCFAVHINIPLRFFTSIMV